MPQITARREKQTRYLSQAIQLEEAVNPQIIRATMGMVSLAILVFIVWAAFTNINEVARTPGEVVPRGYQQTVQNLEGGMIKLINVHEGDNVVEGQVLLVMNDSGAKADLDRAHYKQLALEMQEERLRAFINNREPDFSSFTELSPELMADQNAFFEGMKFARDKEAKVIFEQIRQKKQSLQSLQSDLETAQSNEKIVRDIYAKRKKLNEQGYFSDVALLESKARMNGVEGEIKRLNSQLLVSQNEIGEFEDRLASLTAQHRDEALEKLDAISNEKDQNREIVQKLEDRIARLEVKSPTNGQVKGLAVNTVGEVVQPGQILMEIIPFDAQLEVQVKISPKDIGHIRRGQNVQIKFSTFDFSRYGFVKGMLDQISATTFTGEGGERYYRGRVVLEQNYVGHDKHNTIMPGMTVMADVITGEKTILQYLLKPIHLSLKSAFSER